MTRRYTDPRLRLRLRLPYLDLLLSPLRVRLSRPFLPLSLSPGALLHKPSYEDLEYFYTKLVGGQHKQ